MITRLDPTHSLADYRNMQGKRRRLIRTHEIALIMHGAVEARRSEATRRRLAYGTDLRCRQQGTACRRIARIPHPANGKPSCLKHTTE